MKHFKDKRLKYRIGISRTPYNKKYGCCLLFEYKGVKIEDTVYSENENPLGIAMSDTDKYDKTQIIVYV